MCRLCDNDAEYGHLGGEVMINLGTLTNESAKKNNDQSERATQKTGRRSLHEK